MTNDRNQHDHFSQLMYQPNIKLNSPLYDFDTDVFVISVDTAALIRGNFSG